MHALDLAKEVLANRQSQCANWRYVPPLDRMRVEEVQELLAFIEHGDLVRGYRRARCILNDSEMWSSQWRRVPSRERKAQEKLQELIAMLESDRPVTDTSPTALQSAT
jgi:hypothetical protein